MAKAIILLSAGLDSTAIAAYAMKTHDEVFFLHISYGQRTARKEKQCFDAICEHYNIPETHKKVIGISHLSQIGGSSLTDETIEVADYKGDSNEIPTTYVPFRNAHILSVSVSWAEVLEVNSIYIGANEEDSPGYPDCRPAYYEAFNKLIEVGTAKGTIKIHTPVIHMKKKEIIEFGLKYQAPFELSWSCYRSEEKACGTCDSCALRLRGFKDLGLTDPIQYN